MHADVYTVKKLSALTDNCGVYAGRLKRPLSVSRLSGERLDALLNGAAAADTVADVTGPQCGRPC